MHSSERPLDDTANSLTSQFIELEFFSQGRCIWHNPVTKNEDEFDDEEVEDEQEEVEEPQPETGPPLLASVNEDEG